MSFVLFICVIVRRKKNTFASGFQNKKKTELFIWPFCLDLQWPVLLFLESICFYFLMSLFIFFCKRPINIFSTYVGTIENQGKKGQKTWHINFHYSFLTVTFCYKCLHVLIVVVFIHLQQESSWLWFINSCCKFCCGRRSAGNQKSSTIVSEWWCQYTKWTTIPWSDNNLSRVSQWCSVPCRN